MSILLALVAVLVQDPEPEALPRRARPLRVQSDVRVIIEESPEGDFDHDYYEQFAPVEHATGAGALRSRIWYRTVCRPQDEDRAPIFLAAPRPSPPQMTLSGTFGAPRLTVTSTGNFSVTTTTVTGRDRTDPIITKPSSKPAIFGASSGSSSNSDAPYLYGPDLDLLVASDLSSWHPTRWVPERTALHLYGRALFGTFEVFDTPASLQLYGVGPRLSVPVATVGGFNVDAVVSAGPAFLRTGIGDAVGFDGGIGLQLEHKFSDAVSFVAAVEANLFFSENVTAFGPVVNLGFNLGW